jgi:anti-sigma regulatory factor (Ser/Thr protein kinase)
MSNPIELILPNRPAEIARVHEQLETLAQQFNVPAQALHAVQLAVEEHLSNICKYAYADPGEHQIQVRLQFALPELRAEIEDDGRPFNPLEFPAPDVSVPMDQRAIGGLGVHMIRQSMDRVEYRRAGGKNILTLAKRFKAPVP